MRYGKTAMKCLVVVSLLAAMPACSNKREDLKSPCVGTEESPCGPHRPINSWWMKDRLPA